MEFLVLAAVVAAIISGVLFARSKADTSTTDERQAIIGTTIAAIVLIVIVWGIKSLTMPWDEVDDMGQTLMTNFAITALWVIGGAVYGSIWGLGVGHPWAKAYRKIANIILVTYLVCQALWLLFTSLGILEKIFMMVLVVIAVPVISWLGHFTDGLKKGAKLFGIGKEKTEDEKWEERMRRMSEMQAIQGLRHPPPQQYPPQPPPYYPPQQPPQAGGQPPNPSQPRRRRR